MSHAAAAIRKQRGSCCSNDSGAHRTALKASGDASGNHAVLVRAHPDSGCTGSLTPRKELLVNTRDDLNPIAERVIGVISTHATAVRLSTEASPKLWPWLIAYCVDWHNATIGSAGSSATDANVSPHQRFTLRQPRVMDLAAFGSRAIVLKPPTHQHKPSLSSRGWQGSLLGRSRNMKGGYDVLVNNNQIVHSSSVLVDEEHFDWAPKAKSHHVAGLGAPESRPTPLSTDSQSARDLSYNPEHHDRMKHVERRHFFIRDMVESLKIEVPLVRTFDNWSDFFTKVFDAKKFHAMRRIIMNDPERA